MSDTSAICADSNGGMRSKPSWSRLLVVSLILAGVILVVLAISANRQASAIAFIRSHGGTVTIEPRFGDSSPFRWIVPNSDWMGSVEWVALPENASSVADSKEWIRAVETFRDLEVLELTGIRVARGDLANLIQRNEFWGLDLSRAQLERDACDELANAKTMELIGLASSNLTDDMTSFLTGMTNLGHAYLGDTHVGIETCKRLGSMSRLQFVELDRTLVDGRCVIELARSSTIYSLHLSGTQISDESVPMLSSMKSLRILDVSNTNVTDEGKQKLREPSDGPKRIVK